jgi:hypothetical protein
MWLVTGKQLPEKPIERSQVTLSIFIIYSCLPVTSHIVNLYYIQLFTGYKSHCQSFYIQLYIVPRETQWLVTSHIVNLYYIQLYIVPYYIQLYIIKIDNMSCDRSIGFSGYYKQLYIIKIDNVTCDRSMGFSEKPIDQSQDTLSIFIIYSCI